MGSDSCQHPAIDSTFVGNLPFFSNLRIEELPWFPKALEQVITTEVHLLVIMDDYDE